MLQTDLAYFAGVLDSEGWFSIQRTIDDDKRKCATYSASVGVANTEIVLIDWLAARFGGTVRERKPARGQLGTKLRYEWRLRISEVRVSLPVTIPYLVIKTRQANLILQLLDTHSIHFRGIGVPQDTLMLRESIYLQLRTLNSTNHPIGEIEYDRAKLNFP